MSSKYSSLQTVRSFFILFLIFIALNLRSQPSNKTKEKLKETEQLFRNDTSYLALKKEVFALRYSDPDRAINLCVSSLRGLNALGASSIRLYLYASLGQLYADKSLPVLGLSYTADALYEFTQLEHSQRLTGIYKAHQEYLSQPPYLSINMGNVYFGIGNLDRARDFYYEAEASFLMLDSLNGVHQGLSTTYNNLGLCFIESEEFGRALHYTEKAMKIRVEKNLGPADISHSYSMMCNLFYKWDRLDEAKRYLKKVDSIHYEFNESNRPKYDGYSELSFALAESYVANVYEYKGDYIAGLGDYKNAIIAYRRAEKFFEALPKDKARVRSSLAKTFLQMNDAETSLAIIDSNIRLIRKKKLTSQLEQAFAIKIKILDKLNLEDSARIISDELMFTQENRFQIQISQLLDGLEEKNETLIRSKELEVEILADRKIMFLSIITILILTVIAGYFYSRKILLNRKMIILSKEDQLSMSKLEFKERELVSLSTQMLRENVELNAVLKQLLQSVSRLDKKSDAVIFRELILNLRKLISTKGNNESFAAQFSAAYPGYQEGLIARHPDLNSGDLQLCTLLRLNLESKEIAQIIGLSVRSIESRRYRLRKKLNIDANVDLVSFLIAFQQSTSSPRKN